MYHSLPLYKLGLGKRFKCWNLRSFAVNLKVNLSLLSFAATPTLMFAHTHLYNLNMYTWSIMWMCSRKVEVVLVAASDSFLTPAMLNPSRNNDRYRTSTLIRTYKPVLESIYSQLSEVRAKLIKTCANPRIFASFCWQSFEYRFTTFILALVEMYSNVKMIF